MDRKFRHIVLLNIFLLAIVEALAWFYTPSDAMGAEFRALDGYGAVIEGGLPFYLLMVSTKLLILLGLLSFHPTARLLFLAYVVVTVPMSVLWGFRVSAPIENPFNYLEVLLDGVVIALAYCSPASARFRTKSE